MDSKHVAAIVTGGASGLGEAVVREIVHAGGRAAILDVNADKAAVLVKELGDGVFFHKTDVTNEGEVSAAIDAAVSHFGSLTVAVNAAGIAMAGKTLSKNGPFDLKLFDLTMKINVLGTFNVIRLAAARMSTNVPDGDGERGVIVNTASVAAYDGQVGQAAYAASKAAIVGMTLPIARDLAEFGIRNVTIAPGIFTTPMSDLMPDKMRDALLAQFQFPKRFGRPGEFADLVMAIINNSMLNGETIRLDAAMRMAPR